MSAQPKSSGGGSKTILIVVGVLVAVCVLVPICVIGLLTLLGPQVGNVFSQVNSGLK